MSYEKIARMPEYQKVVESLDAFRRALEDAGSSMLDDFASIALFAAGSAAYRDMCPECKDPHAVYAPHEAEPEGEKGVRCSYLCRRGHRWTCSWARRV